MKKIKRSKLLLLGIFIYIIFQILTLFISKNTKTLLLESEKLNVKLTTKGIFIREEYLVQSNEKGIVDILYDEGSKVQKSQEIACVYKDDNIDGIDSKIETLNKEIKDLNVELQDDPNKLGKELLLTQITTKKEQKKILQNKKEKSMLYLNSPISGVISYKFDGNEEKYNLESLGKITKEDIEKGTDNYKNINVNNSTVKKGDFVVKVINNNEIYLAICVDEKESENFALNKDVKINFDNKEIDGKVEKIYKDKSDYIVIVKITNQNIGIYDTRAKEFDIIYKQIEGLKIPKSSIKVVDNKRGVYVINEETKDVDFVELKGISYENDEFVFIDYYRNSIQGEKTVNLHAEIILKPNNINKNIKIK